MGPYPGASQFLVVNCCGFGLGTQKMEPEKGVGAIPSLAPGGWNFFSLEH